MDLTADLKEMMNDEWFRKETSLYSVKIRNDNQLNLIAGQWIQVFEGRAESHLESNSVGD